MSKQGSQHPDAPQETGPARKKKRRKHQPYWLQERCFFNTTQKFRWNGNWWTLGKYPTEAMAQIVLEKNKRQTDHYRYATYEYRIINKDNE